MKLTSLKSRPRLIVATILSILSFLLSFKVNTLVPLSLIEKALISYNIFQWCYLSSLLYVIGTTKPHEIKKRAIIEDESANFVLFFSSFSSIAAICAIALELASAKGSSGISMGIHLTLPAITLIGIWSLLPIMCAIHYAHLFYLSEDKPPFNFPEDDEIPDYFDFLYFSITIALTSQTSDVTIKTKQARRLVLFQSILAFIFNTSVLALGINVSASLLN